MVVVPRNTKSYVLHQSWPSIYCSAVWVEERKETALESMPCRERNESIAPGSFDTIKHRAMERNKDAYC